MSCHKPIPKPCQPFPPWRPSFFQAMALPGFLELGHLLSTSHEANPALKGVRHLAFFGWAEPFCWRLQLLTSARHPGQAPWRWNPWAFLTWSRTCCGCWPSYRRTFANWPGPWKRFRAWLFGGTGPLGIGKSWGSETTSIPYVSVGPGLAQKSINLYIYRSI